MQFTIHQCIRESTCIPLTSLWHVKIRAKAFWVSEPPPEGDYGETSLDKLFSHESDLILLSLGSEGIMEFLPYTVFFKRKHLSFSVPLFVKRHDPEVIG